VVSAEECAGEFDETRVAGIAGMRVLAARRVGTQVDTRCERSVPFAGREAFTAFGFIVLDERKRLLRGWPHGYRILEFFGVREASRGGSDEQ
jgi:hypothetical protein